MRLRARWVILLLSIVTLVSVAAVPRYLKWRGERRREAGYQATLSEYSRALKPGSTRKDVEQYLKAKGITFGRFCCVDERKGFATMLELGREDGPWYCSGIYVSVAFVFPPNNMPTWSPDDADVLEGVQLFRLPGGCV